MTPSQCADRNLCPSPQASSSRYDRLQGCSLDYGSPLCVCAGHGGDRRTAQRSSWMRIRLPAGSRKAQSRTPYGCSVGSWTTSASLACSRSKVPSRSLVARRMPAVGALGHHLGDGAALVVGDAGVGGRRRQDDGRAGLVGGADRDPAHLAVSDVVADLEAEGVAVEGQGGVRVVVREEARVNGDVHGGHASCGSVAGASRFLIGLVTCFATHGGIPAVARAAWRR